MNPDALIASANLEKQTPRIFYFYMCKLGKRVEMRTSIITAFSSAEAEARLQELSKTYQEWYDYTDFWLETDEAQENRLRHGCVVDYTDVGDDRFLRDISTSHYVRWLEATTDRICDLTGQKLPPLLRSIKLV